jgi:hypothetical protein
MDRNAYRDGNDTGQPGLHSVPRLYLQPQPGRAARAGLLVGPGHLGFGRLHPRPNKVAELRRGVPAQESLSWNRAISLPGCVTVASSARPGTYQVQARDASVTSPVRTFKLARL